MVCLLFVQSDWTEANSSAARRLGVNRATLPSARSDCACEIVLTGGLIAPFVLHRDSHKRNFTRCYRRSRPGALAALLSRFARTGGQIGPNAAHRRDADAVCGPRDRPAPRR